MNFSRRSKLWLLSQALGAPLPGPPGGETRDREIGGLLARDHSDPSITVADIVMTRAPMARKSAVSVIKEFAVRRQGIERRPPADERQAAEKERVIRPRAGTPGALKTRTGG